MKRGTPRHPKVYDLMQALDLPMRSRPIVIGYLELLWHFTAEFAPQGDIGKFTDDRIEGSMDWSGKRGKLITAMVKVGWIDAGEAEVRPDSYGVGPETDPTEPKLYPTRLVVHDWHDHADDSVRKRLTRAGLSFLSVTGKVTVQCPAGLRTSAENVRLPLPLPKLEPETKPEPAAEPPLEFPRTIPSWRNDETYVAFVKSWRSVARVTGKPIIDEDFTEAHFRWARLDFDQKLLAVKTTNDHLDLNVWTGATDPQYVPLPKKYLELEYKRPVVPPKIREPTTFKTKQEIQAERWDRA